MIIISAVIAAAVLGGCAKTERPHASLAGGLVQYSSGGADKPDSAVSSESYVLSVPEVSADVSESFSESSSENASEQEAPPDTVPMPPESAQGETFLYNCSSDAPCFITFSGNSIIVRGTEREYFHGVSCKDPKGTVATDRDDEEYIFTATPDLDGISGKFGTISIKDKNSYLNRVMYEVTDDGLRLAYSPDILSSNLEKVSEAETLSVGKTLQYITADGRADGADRILDEIKSISDSICEGITDDYEKARAITYWVSENIYYDHPAVNKGIPQECLSLEYMLNNKASVCGGYANMTSALCAAQGIKCYNIKGEGLMGGKCFLQGLDGEYHEWNVAEINGRLVNMDSGLNSNNNFRVNKTFDTKAPNYKYFDVGSEVLAIDHKVKTVEYRDFYGLDFSGGQ